MMRWRTAVSGGAVWVVAYNLLWGIAWFAFMRDEWMRASASVGRPMPWTAEVWFAWGVMTIPMGIGLAAYASESVHTVKRAVAAALAIWLIFTAAMVVHARTDGYDPRVVGKDGLVNLVAMIAASLAVAWSSHSAPSPSHPAPDELV